jgi:hypothetical protein
MKPLSVDGAAPQIDDDQVVSDELIGRLYRATENCVADLLPDMSVEDRAYLAMFCYRKSHLRGIGLAIAATCDESVLVQTWGTALGQTLYAQSRERPLKPQPVPGHDRATITLASVDDEGEAEDVMADQSLAISIRLN